MNGVPIVHSVYTTHIMPRMNAADPEHVGCGIRSLGFNLQVFLVVLPVRLYRKMGLVSGSWGLHRVDLDKVPRQVNALRFGAMVPRRLQGAGNAGRATGE